MYHVGDTVNVWSVAYDTTQTYNYWSGDSVFLAGAHEWHTTLVMPAQNVNLTANIKAMPAYAIHYEQIRGLNNLKNVYSYFPSAMKGVLYLFHGTGGAASNWVTKPEYRSFIDAAIADTFGFIITEAEEVTLDSDVNGDGKIRWFSSPLDSITNVDLANLRIITDSFVSRGNMTHSTNRYAMGMSDGGEFSTIVTYYYHYTTGVSYCAPGSNLLFEHLNAPFAFRMALYDDNPQVGPAGNYAAFQNDSILQSRGICNSYLIHNRQPVYPQRFARVPGVSVSTSTTIYNELVAAGEIDVNGYAIEDSLITQNVAAHPSLYPALVVLPGLTQLGVSNEIAASNAEHMFYSDWNYASLQFMEHLCSYATTPPAIGGTTTVCTGGTTALSSTTTGGTWSSSNPAVGTIGSASGIVGGIAAGTITIMYATASGTGSVVVTVNTLPVAGTITGSGSVCIGSGTSLTDAAIGGVWSSSSAGIATVSSSGLVTGVAAGTAVVSYTVTNSCGAAGAGSVVTVNVTAAGTITGASSVGVGLSITLTDAVSGGAWSISNGNVSVSGGLVTGIAAGTVTVSYSVSGSCGTGVSTKAILVNTPSVSAISGYYFYLCTGAAAAFWDVTPGGSWSMAPAGVATVSATGVVTGISAGTATISYTLGGTSAIATVSVYASPAAISGTGGVCAGGTTALSDATAGGTWSSTIPSIATISTAGLVSGTYSGTTTIYYSTAATGCRASLVMTVVTTPSGIGGPTSVCPGSTIVLNDFVAGGAWSSTAPASIVALGTGSATVTGISSGTAIITYSVGTGCYKTYNVTVKAVTAPVSGMLTVCAGYKTFLSDATTPGISWTSSNTTIGTITASGAVTGLASGTAIMTYTAATGCIATTVVTVNPTPGAVGAISGASSVSHSGGPITLSDTTAGGLWSSSNTAILTVGSTTGIVTALVSAGSASISYIVTNGFGCSAAAAKVISTRAAPPAQTGSATTTVGATLNLADEAIGGDWTSSDNTIATVDNNGIVTAIRAGNATITHAATNVNNEVSTTLTQLIIDPTLFEISMVPNPGTGAFVVRGMTGTGKDEPVMLEITNMLGQVVYTNRTIARGGIINEPVLLGSDLANGMYLLNVHCSNEHRVLHFVIAK